MCQDIFLVVDYHDTHSMIRIVDRAPESQTVRKATTAEHTLNGVVEEAAKTTRDRGGRLVWLQESTTGWARVKGFLKGRAEFLLANVLQMPLPPKAIRNVLADASST